MRRMHYSILLVPALCVLLGAASCELFDPPMCEVGMHITDKGKNAAVLVQVFNELGRQTQEVASNELGVVYVKRLVAGTWTFKFIGHEGRVYPAVRTISLQAGATAYLPVELTREKDPESEAAASAAVVSYGENDLSP